MKVHALLSDTSFFDKNEKVCIIGIFRNITVNKQSLLDGQFKYIYSDSFFANLLFEESGIEFNKLNVYLKNISDQNKTYVYKGSETLEEGSTSQDGVGLIKNVLVKITNFEFHKSGQWVLGYEVKGGTSEDLYYFEVLFST